MGIELTTLVVIGTDWIGSCKPNYNTNYDHDHDQNGPLFLYVWYLMSYSNLIISKQNCASILLRWKPGILPMDLN